MHIQVVIKIILWWKMVVCQKKREKRPPAFHMKIILAKASRFWVGKFWQFRCLCSLAEQKTALKTLPTFIITRTTIFGFFASSFSKCVPSFSMLWFKRLITIYRSFVFPSAPSHFVLLSFLPLSTPAYGFVTMNCRISRICPRLRNR